MEKLFSLEYGIGGICVLLVISILVKVGEFVWKIKEQKDTLSETAIMNLTKAVQDSTVATRHLECRLQELEDAVMELPKFKTDLRRFYAAIKNVAGDRWPAVRDEIMKDDFNL